jgi:MFS family permease
MNDSLHLSAADTPPLPWYRTITREQWNSLGAAMLGWMLDAMDFVLFLMAITTLQQEFPEFDRGNAGLVTTITLLTSATGGLLFGVVADRIGRTRALMGTILIFSLCSLGAATSQTWVQLALWRAALGFGMGGEWASGAVLVSETWPAQHRGKAIGIMQSGWALGYILAALLAALVLPVLGWRWLFVCGVLPAFFILWVRRQVHEPALWAARHQAQPGQSNPFAIIFGRALLYRTLMATALAAAVMFGYWGVFTWLPNFLGSPLDQGGAGMDVRSVSAWVIPTQLGAFFGYLSFGFISDKLGRRRTFILYMVAAAVLVPFYGQMARHSGILLAVGPLLGFFGHGYFSVFGAMLSELFPTRVRATAQGLTYNIGRGLGALAPLTIGTLAETQGIGSALALTSAFFLAGALLILLVPETRGKALED